MTGSKIYIEFNPFKLKDDGNWWNNNFYIDPQEFKIEYLKEFFQQILLHLK